jgi:hypothetical protein
MSVILMPDDFICQVLRGKVLGANGLSLLFTISSTFTVLQHQEQLMRETDARKNKAAPHCRSCGHPMKGHKNVVDCPKNK